MYKSNCSDHYQREYEESCIKTEEAIKEHMNHLNMNQRVIEITKGLRIMYGVKTKPPGTKFSRRNSAEVSASSQNY